MVKRKKFILGGIVVLVVLGYLGFTAFQNSATYYFTVDELVARESSMIEQNIRVSGRVVSGTVQEEESTHNLLFSIEHDDISLPVVYSGIVPDAFKEDNDVVLEGHLAQDGLFRAHTISVKCPSKYVPDE